MVTRYRATVEDYLAMHEEAPYNEYVDGEIVPKAMPDWFHSLLVKYLTAMFLDYEREFGGRSGSEIRVRFETPGGTAYRLPDYAYWDPDKPHRSGRFGLPPSLAIEVRSEGESMDAQRAKCSYYLRNGVDVAWLVDPESRTVEVFDERHNGESFSEDGVLTSPSLPGFELRLADLFSVLDDE